MSAAQQRSSYNHQSPLTAAANNPAGNSIYQRIIEWEDRLRRWKLFSRSRNRQNQRSTSVEPKPANNFFAGPLFSARTHQHHQHPVRKRPSNFPPGSFTCPVPRKNSWCVVCTEVLDKNISVNLTGRMRNRESMETDRPLVSEDEMNRRFAEIQARSGLIDFGPEKFEGMKIENLELKSELGSGTCGSVTKRVLHNRFLAVKEMKRTDNDQETRRIFTDLQVICKSNNCPFIVRCYGYILTYDHVYICMEMMAMCLEKLYKKYLIPNRVFIPEAILGQVTVSVIKALKYLKDEHEIIHRDVKPSNILIDWNGNIKLCDFGIAGQLIDSLASTSSMGCAAYLSPERLQGARRYDVRADIWSLGISLIELAMFQYPYHFDSPFMLMVNITDQPAPRLPDTFSIDMRNFVDKCLEKDPQARPKYNELVDFPWFVKSETNPVDVSEWLQSALGENED